MQGWMPRRSGVVERLHVPSPLEAKRERIWTVSEGVTNGCLVESTLSWLAVICDKKTCGWALVRASQGVSSGMMVINFQPELGLVSGFGWCPSLEGVYASCFPNKEFGFGRALFMSWSNHKGARIGLLVCWCIAQGCPKGLVSVPFSFRKAWSKGLAGPALSYSLVGKQRRMRNEGWCIGVSLQVVSKG